MTGEGSHCVNKSDVTFPETVASSADVAGIIACRVGSASEPLRLLYDSSLTSMIGAYENHGVC